MKAANLKKRRQQRTRKTSNPISAVKTKPRDDPMRVALEARQRVYGVSADDASQPEAGTVLGRLKLSGAITETMYEAGKRYLELYQAYLKALKAPTGLAKGSGSASEADASEEYVEWAIRAVAHYEVMKAALEDEVGIRGRMVFELIVIDDGPLAQASITLQVGLSFLARKMGFENSQRAA